MGLVIAIPFDGAGRVIRQRVEDEPRNSADESRKLRVGRTAIFSLCRLSPDSRRSPEEGFITELRTEE
jgi:hypothetical protein